MEGKGKESSNKNHEYSNHKPMNMTNKIIKKIRNKCGFFLIDIKINNPGCLV